MIEDQEEVGLLSHGIIFNAYLYYYSRAFAFSSFLYLHLCRLTLRLAFLMKGEIQAYRVPYNNPMNSLGALFPPVGVLSMEEETSASSPPTYFLVKACQHLWLLLSLTTFIKSSHAFAILFDPCRLSL